MFCVIVHPVMTFRRPTCQALSDLADRLLRWLQANTVAPVLYASQWFLTLFACPFPSAFSARVIDIILTEGHSEILLQACISAEETLPALFTALQIHSLTPLCLLRACH